MKKKLVVLFGMSVGVILLNVARPDESYHPEFSNDMSWEAFGISTASAYPPGVGISSNSTSCASCHVDNGPWKDDENLIIDILDAGTRVSMKQPDGSFVLEMDRWEQKTFLTVIGSYKNGGIPVPEKNAWIFIDTTTIGTASLSKFAPNWDVNLSLSCRVVGDQLPEFENANLTSLPMTIQPLGNAENTEIQFQVMLTKGQAVKGNAQEGLTGSYFQRRVKLVVK